MKQEIEFQTLSPNLMVKSVNASVDFYTRMLGFAKVEAVPKDGDYQWAMVSRGNVSVMFQSEHSLKEDVPAMKLKEGTGCIFYIRLKNIDEFHAAIKGKAEIVLDMRKTFYGAQEFAVKDPDGYYLLFAETKQ